jgi:hydroxymethylbilane synthase
MARTFVVGTRGSRLALRQTQIVIDALRVARPGTEIAVREIKTEGDRSSAPLSEIGGLGVFTKAIEDALLAGEVDLAVHSLKDLPPRITDGLVIAAVPARGDPRDALVTAGGRTLASLPPGARIGSGSARRSLQLLRLRPDLRMAEIRGNVDTRVRKVETGEYDGAVLAVAGLERLRLREKAAHVFSLEEMVPAVGQGALAVETRAGDAEARALVATIDDAGSRACVEAERAFLAKLGAGCRMPVGAHATVDGGRLALTAMVGEARRTETLPAEGAAEAARRLAAELLAASGAPAEGRT